MASFLLDENVPHALVDALTNVGHQVRTVQEAGLTSALDETVFDYAQANQATVISLDLDFSDLRSFPAGNHCGIVVLRLKDAPPAVMAERAVEALSGLEQVDLAGALVIVDRNRIRRTRP